MYLPIGFWQDLVAYVSLFLVLAGFVGNILTFKIYWSFLNKNSMSLYFRTISVVNAYQLLHMLRHIISGNFYWDFKLTGGLACKLTDFSQYGFNAIPGWILVLIALDRLRNITKSKKFSFFCKRHFQWLVIILLFISQPVYYSYLIWNSRLEANDSWSNDSTSKLACVNHAAQLLSWLDLVNSTILPFMFMIVLTTLLIYYIKTSRSRVYVRRLSSIKANNKTSRDRKFAITSVSLNLLYLIINLPGVVYNVLYAYSNINSHELNTFLSFTTTNIFYSLYVVDFYVQLLVNSVFRKKFLLLCKFKSNKRQ